MLRGPFLLLACLLQFTMPLYNFSVVLYHSSPRGYQDKETLRSVREIPVGSATSDQNTAELMKANWHRYSKYLTFKL